MRGAGWGIVLCALWAGPARGTEEPQPAPSQALVDAAVARGVKFLRGEQKRDGSFGTQPGETALALLALRHSGVPPEDRTCMRAAENLLRELPDGTAYGASFGILGLLAQHPDRHREFVQELVDELAAGQCENGQWSYLLRRGGSRKLGDNSNTQCALLALGAARAHGLRVPQEVFTAALGFLEKTQNRDGGYGYAARQSKASYGSMTAGMATTLLICRAAARGEPVTSEAVRDTEEMRRALAWLAEHWDPADNPDCPDGWRYYWLWSVERCCTLAGAERLGDVDWYASGARFLLDVQTKDGSWRQSREVPDTCWALLFFARSTLRILTPSGRPVTGD